MWAIAVISSVLMGNLGLRFSLGAFVLEKLLRREELKQDLVLKTLAVIRQPNATNYKIRQQDRQSVHELRGKVMLNLREINYFENRVVNLIYYHLHR